MSGESNTTLDRLEAELFRDARLELEPDQARVEGLWQSVAAASALGAGFSGGSASVPPASGTGWAAPRPVTSAPTQKDGLTQGGPQLQKTGQASFGLRALFGAAVGGALLGFAAGYGSAGGAQDALGSPGVATMASSKASGVSSGNANSAHASQATAAEAAAAVTDAASRQADEPQAPAVARSNSAKPQLGRSGATPGSSERTAESAKPSFYEELEYLKRAQSALRQGNGALALGLMTSLDSIQPDGALLSERGVTRVLAHCQLGDIESAQRVAQRLAASGLASVYAERLEKSCARAVLSKP